MTTIPNTFYRISLKALILDERKNILLALESDGTWNLPGGGLDFGEDVKTCLTREMKEEMGLEVTYVADHPAYFATVPHYENWRADIAYITTVKDLNFTPSDECVEIKFFSKEEALQEKVFPGARAIIEQFNMHNHNES